MLEVCIVGVLFGIQVGIPLPVSYSESQLGTTISWPAATGAKSYVVRLGNTPVLNQPGPIYNKPLELKVFSASCFVPRNAVYGQQTISIVARAENGAEIPHVTENYQFQGPVGEITGDGARLNVHGEWIFPATGGMNGSGCLVKVGRDSRPCIVFNFPPSPQAKEYNPYRKLCTDSAGKVYGLIAPSDGNFRGSGGVFVWDPTIGEGGAGFQYSTRCDVEDITVAKWANGNASIIALSRGGYTPETSVDETPSIWEVVPGSVAAPNLRQWLVLPDDAGYGIAPRYLAWRNGAITVAFQYDGEHFAGTICKFLPAYATPYVIWQHSEQINLLGSSETDPDTFSFEDFVPGLFGTSGTTLLPARLPVAQGGYHILKYLSDLGAAAPLKIIEVPDAPLQITNGSTMTPLRIGSAPQFGDDLCGIYSSSESESGIQVSPNFSQYACALTTSTSPAGRYISLIPTNWSGDCDYLVTYRLY